MTPVEPKRKGSEESLTKCDFSENCKDEKRRKEANRGIRDG